jgi:hypothetical protein
VQCYLSISINCHSLKMYAHCFLRHMDFIKVYCFSIISFDVIYFHLRTLFISKQRPLVCYIFNLSFLSYHLNLSFNNLIETKHVECIEWCKKVELEMFKYILFSSNMWILYLFILVFDVTSRLEGRKGICQCIVGMSLWQWSMWVIKFSNWLSIILIALGCEGIGLSQF